MKPGVDYIGVGVGAIIIDNEGRLFADRRGPKCKNEKGRWEFPGGSVEYGEKLKDTIRREVYEEFGMEIAVTELIDVVDHIIIEEKQHWVSPTFLCTIISGEPVIREPEKCTEIGWFYPSEVPEDLTGASRESLAHYKEYLLKKSGDGIPKEK